MIQPEHRNPLIDQYAWISPEDQLVPHELAQATLQSLCSDLRGVIPEVEMPQISPLLGTVNCRDSDPVMLESPEVPYPLPDGRQTQLMVSISRPRVLHELGLDATQWSKIGLSIHGSRYLDSPGWVQVAWIGSDWGFELKNNRSIVQVGTIKQLGQFVGACHYVKDCLEQ